jgi:hypothetical protein
MTALGYSRDRSPMRLLIALLAISVAGCSVVRRSGSEGEAGGGAPDFLLSRARRAQLLMVGTFHFANPGLDLHKVAHPVDMSTPRRQHEIEEIVRQLALYEPTRICVEAPATRQARLDSLYDAYRAGGAEPSINEVYQVGFRLARLLGHTRVYAIDAPSRAFTPDLTAEEFAAHAHALGQDSLLQSPWSARYEALYQYEDSLKPTMTLREYLRFLNAPERVTASHGSYLEGRFRVGRDTDYTGPDDATSWYNRNLRLFANVQRVTSSADDRVLLIVGAGHLPILRFLAQSAPDLQLVDLRDYL